MDDLDLWAPDGLFATNSPGGKQGASPAKPNDSSESSDSSDSSGSKKKKPTKKRSRSLSVSDDGKKAKKGKRSKSATSKKELQTNTKNSSSSSSAKETSAPVTSTKDSSTSKENAGSLEENAATLDDDFAGQFGMFYEPGMLREMANNVKEKSNKRKKFDRALDEKEFESVRANTWPEPASQETLKELFAKKHTPHPTAVNTLNFNNVVGKKAKQSEFPLLRRDKTGKTILLCNGDKGSELRKWHSYLLHMGIREEECVFANLVQYISWVVDVGGVNEPKSYITKVRGRLGLVAPEKFKIDQEWYSTELNRLDNTVKTAADGSTTTKRVEKAETFIFADEVRRFVGEVKDDAEWPKARLGGLVNVLFAGGRGIDLDRNDSSKAWKYDKPEQMFTCRDEGVNKRGKVVDCRISFALLVRLIPSIKRADAEDNAFIKSTLSHINGETADAFLRMINDDRSSKQGTATRKSFRRSLPGAILQWRDSLGKAKDKKWPLNDVTVGLGKHCGWDTEKKESWSLKYASGYDKYSSDILIGDLQKSFLPTVFEGMR